MTLLKPLIVGLLILLGVLFVYEGMGFDFIVLNFESLDPYMTTIGSAIVVLALLTFWFWRVPE